MAPPANVSKQQTSKTLGLKNLLSWGKKPKTLSEQAEERLQRDIAEFNESERREREQMDAAWERVQRAALLTRSRESIERQNRVELNNAASLSDVRSEMAQRKSRPLIDLGGSEGASKQAVRPIVRSPLERRSPPIISPLDAAIADMERERANLDM